jgi:hypothetical protein
MPWALLRRSSMSPLGAETANSELDLALKEPVRSSGVCFKILSPRTSLRGGMVPPDLSRSRAFEIGPRTPQQRGRRAGAQTPGGSTSCAVTTPVTITWGRRTRDVRGDAVRAAQPGRLLVSWESSHRLNAVTF